MPNYQKYIKQKLLQVSMIRYSDKQFLHLNNQEIKYDIK